MSGGFAIIATGLLAALRQVTLFSTTSTSFRLTRIRDEQDFASDSNR